MHRGLLGIAVVLILASSAFATPFNNSTGLATPHTTILFSELGLPADTVITNQYAGLGATFSPLLYQNPQGFPSPNIDTTPDSVSNFSFSGGATQTVFSIHFGSVLTEAAFAMITNPGTSLFEALLGGSVVDSGSFGTSFGSPQNFYGFSGLAFDEIRVTPGGANNGAMILDNLQIGTPVPEPSTLLLMLAGSSLGIRRLRKGAKNHDSK